MIVIYDRFRSILTIGAIIALWGVSSPSDASEGSTTTDPTAAVRSDDINNESETAHSNTPATTDSLSNDTPKKQVAELKARARDLLEKQQYEPALSILKQAFDIAPSPLLMFNIAMCEKALSRHVEAVRSFHAFFKLQEAEKKPNPKLEEMANAALNDLDPLVSTLEIQDAPEGAIVEVDGIEAGVIPLDMPLYVVPGRHMVTVSNEDGETMTVDVLAQGGANVPVRADLSKAPAILEVQCNDAAAQVFIDGDPVGTCPFESELPKGKHEIRIEAPGKKTVVQVIHLAPRRTNLVSVDLQPVIQTNDIKPLPQPSPHPSKVFFAAGISMTALGVVGLGTGLGFALARESQATKANEINANIMSAEEKASWHNYNNAAKRYKKNLIIGFAVGSSLAVVGTSLITYYLIETQKKGETSDALSIGPAGLQVFF